MYAIFSLILIINQQGWENHDLKKKNKKNQVFFI